MTINLPEILRSCGIRMANQFGKKALMPKGPQGQKRPADFIGNAVQVTKIAKR